jgi:putative copper export protein
MWVAVGIGLATLIALAAATGLTSPETPPGLPSSPQFVTWALPVLQWIRDGVGIITVGLVLVGGLLAPTPQRSFLKAAALWSILWIVATVAHAIASLADIFLLPISTAVEPGVWWVYVTDTIPGRVSAYQVLAVALCIPLLVSLRTRRGSVAAFILVLTAVAAPAFSGHAGLGAGHESATASLGLHIASLAVWIGGLIATTLYVVNKYPNRDDVVRRFSAVALWCVIIAVETGLINASLRLPTWASMFTTTYGQIIIAKAVLLTVLIWFGWMHRRRTLPQLRQENVRPFISLALSEIGIMAVALALSVVLARTNPDAPTGVQDPGISLFWVAVLGTGFVVFLWAFVTSRKTEQPWPVTRLLAAFGALVVMILATSEPSGSYAQIAFGLHVLQTTLLTFAAPLLIVAAVPSLLRSAVAVWLRRYPEAVAIALIVVFYQVIFSPFYAVLMASHEGHLIMQLLLFGAGSAFMLAVLDRSVLAIVIPMIAWPFILIGYPSTQALANVLVTELLLAVVLWRTWFQRQDTPESVDVAT